MAVGVLDSLFTACRELVPDDPVVGHLAGVVTADFIGSGEPVRAVSAALGGAPDRRGTLGPDAVGAAGLRRLARARLGLHSVLTRRRLRQPCSAARRWFSTRRRSRISKRASGETVHRVPILVGW